MKIAIGLSCPPAFEPAARYTLKTMLDVVGLPFEFTSSPPRSERALLLFYGAESDRPPQAGVVIATDRECPDSNAVPLERRQDGPLLLPDVVRAAFSMLTQQGTQERVWAHPRVNAYAWQLLDALVEVARRRGSAILHIWPWPYGAPYAVTLSHDVDQTERYNPSNGWLLLRRALRTREWRGLPRGAFYTLLGLWGRLARRGPDPSWHFERIMAAEKAAGYRSSFYFTPLATSSGRDPAYDVAHPRLRSVLHQLHGGGWEVGVHGSFHSGRSAEQLRRERERLESILNAPVEGIRQHYLRLHVPETFRHQTAAGYHYDSSVGYERAIGFRAGIAAPYHPFDDDAGRALDLLELPMTVMDGPLFWDLGCSSAEAADRTMALLRKIRTQHGLAVLLWHQRVADEKRYPGWWRAYEQLLAYLHKEGSAWVAPGAAVTDWWLAREGIRMESHVDAGGRARWTFLVPQGLQGLTLRMWTDSARGPNVTGAPADIEVDEKGTQVVQLGPLSDGQQFTVGET